MPIDTRFLKQAKDQAGALKRSGVQFLKGNPRTATSAAAAMLLAPLLLKNDNRNYAQTAAFTSPLISAGALAVSQMAPGAGKAADNLYGTYNAQREYRQTINSTEVTYSDIKNAQKAYEDQKIALTMFQNMKRRFYAGRRRGKGNVTREAESLTRMVEENLTSESNLRYLSNSIHAERLRTSSAGELADYGRSFLGAEDAAAGFSGAIPKIAPILSAGEVRQIVQGQVKLGNSSFIRGLSSRVHRMKNLIDPSEINPGRLGLPGSAQRAASRYNADIPWASADGIQSKILRERPDLYASINRSIQSGNVSPSNIAVKTTADGNIVGFNYKMKGKRKGMWISYVGENGRIETGGSTFGRTGVARYIDTADSSMRSDTYAFEALGRGFGPRQVKEELKRANMFGLVDSSTDMATYLDPEYGAYVMTNGAQKLRQYQHIPSNLFGFDEGAGYSALRSQKNGPSKQVAAIQALAERHGLTKVGSEAGAYQGVLEEQHLEDLSLNPSREKQNSVWRAETKGVRMGRSPHSHNPDTWSVVRDRLDPFFETNKLQLEGVQDHGVSVRSAGVTPGQQTLFGDMPDVTDVAEAQIKMEISAAENASEAEKSAIRVRAYAESFAAEGRYDVHAMSILQAENKLTHAESKTAWNEIVKYLSNPGNTRIMKKAGRVGEGEFLTEPGLYGANVERYVRYDVHEPLIHDWDQYTGTSIEERFGAKAGQSVMIGRNNGNPVVAGGTQNFIENVFDMGEGQTGILVRETRPIGTGTKFDAGSLKGTDHSFAARGDSAVFREGLNVHSRAVGVNAVIPDEVNMFVSQVYNTNKGSEMQDSLASMVGDSLRRAQEQKQLDPLMAKWKDPMHQLGFDYDESLGKMTFDVGNKFTQAMSLEERVAQHTQLLQGMMADVSTRITNHQLDGDAFMRSFADLGGKGGSYTDYVHRYANPSTLRITDDMGWNAAHEVKLAYYTRQQLVGRGQHAIAAELLDRLNYDGDPMMTKQLQSYMNGDRSAITQKVSMLDATGGGSMKNLSADSRAGTFFDPGHAAAGENSLWQMPDGSQVPVLGHDAYGGKVNRFGTGEFSASEHEKELFKLVKMHEKGTATPAAIAAQQAGYENSLKQYLHGKNSLYRADAVDPLAQEFRPMTRPSGLRYDDGSINPFEVGIGREKAAAIKDKSIRDALFNGEDVFMMGTREPVSHTPLYKVTIDDALNGSNIIGMDEGQRALLMADGDGDRLTAHFLKPGGAGADPLINHAQAEAADAVFNQGSIQAHSVGFQQNMTGVGDETRKLVGTAGGDYKSFVGRLKNQRMYTMADALKRRSTAGSIGSGSNIHSLFMTALEENSGVTDAFIKDDLSTFFFQTIKQGPISAAKMKAMGEMDLSKALGINKTLRDSMREGGTFDNFYAGMNQLSQWADGADSTAFHDYLSENREMFRAYHSGFDRSAVNQAVEALTTPADQAFTAKRLGMSEDLFSYAQAASQSQEEARAAGAAGATASAETIGMINKATKEAKAVGREVSKGKAGIILGLGVAAAAIAGIASTHFESPDAVFGRDSSNGYRPEEKAPGHGIPGEGPAGSRAPSRPRRNIVPAQSQTHTAIVAPLGETRDLDVKLRARDRQRAARTAKMMSQMSTDGDSSITVNYRDQMKPGSFHTQERMREAMG